VVADDQGKFHRQHVIPGHYPLNGFTPDGQPEDGPNRPEHIHLIAFGPNDKVTGQQDPHSGVFRPFFSSTNQYKVILEAKPEFQDDPSALTKIYVPGPNVTQVPLSSFPRFPSKVEPLSVNHRGQFPAVTLSFNLAPHASLGAAVKALSANLPKFEASMVVRGDIKTMADLKGKRIGIQEPGGFADLLSRSVLRAAKIDPKEVNFVSIASEDVPALVANQVEYSLLARGIEREVVPAALELGGHFNRPA